MADGNAALEQMIERFRGMSRFAEEVAKEAAPLVQEAARATARAGTDPLGRAWAPRKKDGGRALSNVAEDITAVPVGARVDIVLKGPGVYHHHGVGKTTPARPVIPDGGTGIPPRIAEALQTASENVFARLAGGA